MRFMKHTIALTVGLLMTLVAGAGMANATGGGDHDHRYDPTPPTFVYGDCDTAPDVTIPDHPRWVTYKVKGDVDHGNTVEVKAYKYWYGHKKVIGEWEHTFPEKPAWWECEPPTPAEPSATQPTCDVSTAVITIPADKHHYYIVDGDKAEPGDIEAEAGDHTVAAYLTYNDAAAGEWQYTIADGRDGNCFEPVIELVDEPTCYPEPMMVAVTNPAGNTEPIALAWGDEQNARDLPPGTTATHQSDVDITVHIDGEQVAEYPYPTVPGCKGEPGEPGEPAEPNENDDTAPVANQLPNTGAKELPKTGSTETAQLTGLAGLALLLTGGAALAFARRNN